MRRIEQALYTPLMLDDALDPIQALQQAQPHGDHAVHLPSGSLGPFKGPNYEMGRLTTHRPKGPLEYRLLTLVFPFCSPIGYGVLCESTPSNGQVG